MKDTKKQLARWVNTIPFELQQRHKEKNTLPSKTVPDLNTDLEEILARFTRGEMIPGLGADNGGSEDVTFDSMDMEEFGRLDLDAKIEIITSTQEMIQEARKAQAAAKLAAEAEAKKAAKQAKKGDE